MNERLRTTTAAATPPPEQPTAWYRRPIWLALSAILALAALGGIIGWAVTGNDSGSSAGAPGPSGRPVALNASGVRTLAGAVSQPIYWAGPRKGYLYEFRQDANGNVYVRYLPPGVAAGAPGAKYLTVATYPFKGAFAALKNLKNARPFTVPGRGIAVVSAKYRKSIHLAFPKVDFQVEVFDPSPARVLQLVSSGRIRPVR